MLEGLTAATADFRVPIPSTNEMLAQKAVGVKENDLCNLLKQMDVTEKQVLSTEGDIEKTLTRLKICDTVTYVCSGIFGFFTTWAVGPLLGAGVAVAVGGLIATPLRRVMNASQNGTDYEGAERRNNGYAITRIRRLANKSFVLDSEIDRRNDLATDDSVVKIYQLEKANKVFKERVKHYSYMRDRGSSNKVFYGRGEIEFDKDGIHQRVAYGYDYRSRSGDLQVWDTGNRTVYNYRNNTVSTYQTDSSHVGTYFNTSA
jgi:hypothetical protein